MTYDEINILDKPFIVRYIGFGCALILLAIRLLPENLPSHVPVPPGLQSPTLWDLYGVHDAWDAASYALIVGLPFLPFLFPPGVIAAYANPRGVRISRLGRHDLEVAWSDVRIELRENVGWSYSDAKLHLGRRAYWFHFKPETCSGLRELAEHAGVAVNISDHKRKWYELW